MTEICTECGINETIFQFLIGGVHPACLRCTSCGNNYNDTDFTMLGQYAVPNSHMTHTSTRICVSCQIFLWICSNDDGPNHNQTLFSSQDVDAANNQHSDYGLDGLRFLFGEVEPVRINQYAGFDGIRFLFR